MLDGNLPSIGGPDPGVHRPKATSAKHTAHPVVLLEARLRIVSLDPSPPVQRGSPASLVDRVIFGFTCSNRRHSPIGISSGSILVSFAVSLQAFGVLSFAHRGHILLPWQPLRRLTHSRSATVACVGRRGRCLASSGEPERLSRLLHSQGPVPVTQARNSSLFLDHRCHFRSTFGYFWGTFWGTFEGRLPSQIHSSLDAGTAHYS